MATVLITGASSDIGLALCRRYLAAGWMVLGHHRSDRPEFMDLLAQHVGQLSAWKCDFADTAALDRALPALPPVTALVHLAAAMPACRFEDATSADLLRVLAANAVPALRLMQVLGPGMVERGFGRMVIGSSIGVQFGGGSDSFLYSYSKHAAEFIPRAVRQWAANNVLTNIVRIGVTDTRGHDNFPAKQKAERVARIPAGRMARPDEIAETLYWLGSEQNGYVSGQIVNASGGE